jgi:YidC/Oxa1 family membrane protein insertase
MTQTQRMILALVLSMIFFIVYESFMAPKYTADLNATNVATNTQNQSNAPVAANSSLDAPAQDATKQSAPISQTATTSEVLTTINSSKFKATIDSLGRINLFEIVEDRYQNRDDGTFPDVISSKNELLPLEIRFSDPTLNAEAFKTPYTADSSSLDVKDKGGKVVLTQKLSSTTVTKTITFDENGRYALNVALSEDKPYFITSGSHPVVESDMYTFKGVLIRKAEGNLEKIEDGDAEGNEQFMGSSIISASNKYYTTIFYDFENGLSSYINKGVDENPLPFVKGNQNLTINGYIGAKEFDTLKSIDPRLTDVIEYGFFTFLSKPLFLFLKYLYSIVGNWGWAIVIVTLLIRLVLYPLTFKGMVSMNKLKELSPQIKELQAKYKKEPQKMNAKMMELYKKNGANPMGGCLPMIMQIPVFFAIYRVLLNTVELKHAPWIGWIHDLSVMDPLYILPVLMGASMFWQQRITPTNFTDPMQEKIMKFLPIIFTFFFITFPAGLTLYWFVNNMFSVAQQYYVNSIFAKQKAAKA